jgi:hypothetical protein
VVIFHSYVSLPGRVYGFDMISYGLDLILMGQKKPTKLGDLSDLISPVILLRKE